MKRIATQLPLALLVAAVGFFGLLEPRFVTPGSLTNLLTQSASTIVAATGMTLVLLAGGVDLSVGAVMFLAAAVGGKFALAGGSPAGCALAMLVVGGLFGAVNAAAIAWLRLLPFVVTLATLNIGRGLALELSRTRAMNLPAEFLALGRPAVAIPLMAVVVIVVHGLLTFTRVGRHVYALGESESVAVNSGLDPRRLRFFVFIACGVCAGLAALLTLGQLGAVSPKFGEGREFTAIAAAVLGGTSLFGGRGAVFPGTVVGAVLMQTIESGLVMINADPYAYPVIIGAVIFLAVGLDAWKHRLGEWWRARRRAHSPVELPPSPANR